MNVNQVTLEELQALPGVGPATAEKLVKARPIMGAEQLEELIPPSAWLKIQEQGVEFAFGDDADRDTAKTDNRGAQPTGDAPIIREVVAPQPVIKMQGAQEMVLRRLMPGQQLRQGAEYMCLWNIRLGPQNEAWSPEDPAKQVSVEKWFNDRGMGIKFAHYGPSVQVQGIPGLGLVNLVLFEIIREEENENGKPDSRNEGGD